MTSIRICYGFDTTCDDTSDQVQMVGRIRDQIGGRTLNSWRGGPNHQILVVIWLALGLGRHDV